VRRHDYEAEGALRDRVRSDPRRAKAHTELAAWLARCGRSPQAREALQAGLAQASRTGPLHHLLGLLFAATGRWGPAEQHLERAIAQEPTRLEYLNDLALVQGAAGRAAASVATLHRALALGGEAAGMAWLLGLGEQAVAEAEGRPARRPPAGSRRAAVVESIVARDPETAEALIGTTAEPTPERRETLRAVRKALTRLAAKNPAYPDLYFGLSLVAEQLGEVQRAIREAEKALALAPRYAEAYLLAVRLYEKDGKPAEAADRCRRVTELRPRWLDAHVRLGGLLQTQGLAHEAADAYRKAIAIDETYEAAREGLRVLEGAVPETSPDAGPGGRGGEA